MSTLTHPLQHISGQDHDRRLRRSWRHCQHWKQNNHQSLLCWWHWWLSRRGRRTGKIKCLNKAYGMEVSAKKTKLMTNNASGINTRSKWTEAWDIHKLQVPGLSYNWWGFQALDTFQDTTDNSSIGKGETSLEWQEYFSQFQDTIDALPCHIHLPVDLWTMDPHSRAPKKNTCHGNEVLLQDTMHLIQRLWSPCQEPAGNWTT